MSARDPPRVAGPAARARPGVAPPRWVLPAILALAAALRLLAWQWAAFMNNDGVDFLWQADRLLAGDAASALSHPYHPLYALATALVALLTRNVVAAAIAVSILSALGIVLAVRSLTRSAFPGRPWAAEAAALLAALHGRMLITTSDIQSDGLFLALLGAACAVLFAETSGNVRLRRLLLAGLLTGLSYLARPEGLFVIGAVLLWWAHAMRAAHHRARATAGLLAFLFGTALCVLPYVFVMHDITGRWGLSLKPSVAAVGLSDAAEGHPSPAGCPIASPVIHRAPAAAQASRPPTPALPAPEPAAVPAPAGDSAPAESRAAEEDDDEAPAGDAVESLLVSLTSLWFTLRIDVWVLVLAGLLACWPLRTRRQTALVLLAGAWLLVGALQSSLLHYLGPRHSLVAVMLLLPLAGAGFAWLWDAARAMSGARRAALLLLLVAILVMQAAAGISPRRRGNPARLEALAWAREHSLPGQRLAVHRRKDGFYAQRPVLVMLDLPVRESELHDKLQRYDVALLVLDADRVQRDSPELLVDGRFIERARFGVGDKAVIVLEPADA